MLALLKVMFAEGVIELQVNPPQEKEFVPVLTLPVKVAPASNATVLGMAVRYPLPVTQDWVATALLPTVRVVKLAVLGKAVRYPLPVTQDWVATALLPTVRVVKLAVLGKAVRYPLPVTQDWVATALLPTVRVVKLAVLGIC